MDLQELFRSFDRNKRKSHFKNLLAMAVADNNLDDVEIKYIIKLAERCNISEEEVDSVLKDPESVKFHPPRTRRNRLDQLYDLITVMLVDGDIDKREMDLCKTFALKLKFHPLIVDRLLSDLMELAMQGVSLEKVVKEMPDDL